MDQALPVPISRHFSKQYSLVNSNFTYIEMPRTGHTATGKSREIFSTRNFKNLNVGLVPMADEEGSCGWILAMTFILSPTFEPDRSCLKKILPIDFAGTTMNSKKSAIQFFGTENIWGIEMPNGTITNLAINIQYTFSIFISIFIIYLTS
jgi:hypothetical protein